MATTPGKRSEDSKTLQQAKACQLIILHLDKKRTNVLDIGSGVGTFLYAAKPHYKNAIGLDVSAQMAAFVEKKIGVKVYLQQFDQFDYPEKFSLIHMSHVIEHVPNPN